MGNPQNLSRKNKRKKVFHGNKKLEKSNKNDETVQSLRSEKLRKESSWMNLLSLMMIITI